MIKMRHQLDFADSLRRQPVAVLGLLMRPYSIGMELELLRSRSPFVTSQKFSEIDELPVINKLDFLMNAADVCSQSEAERAESSRLLAGHFRWWDLRNMTRKLRLEKIWRKWEAAIPKFSIQSEVPADIRPATELEKFWNYICAGKTGPEFAKTDGDTPTTPVGAPEMCLLLHYVRSLPRARLDEWGGHELDFPIAIARYEYYTLLESQGKATLKSDFAAQTLADFAEEMDAKVARGEIKLPDIAIVHDKPEEASCQH